MYKFLRLILLVSWIIGPILPPVQALAHQTQPLPSLSQQPSRSLSTTLDADFDGLSTAIEQAGWFNEAGGPFHTDPQLADSDGDGLNDGEEHLYGTDPLNAQSPGLYVEYRPEYQTKKYYPWRQFGDKFITHSSISPRNERDVITRRGTTLYIGAPPNATVEVIKSQSNLTTLSAVRHSCGGGWSITIPKNSDLGTYTIRATDGSWQKDLTLHVIFELDTPQGELTQEHIDVFGYNDDLSNEKDNITMYFDTSYEYIDDPDFDVNNHNVYGWAIGWDTQFTKRYVFEDFVMPAVQNFNNRKSVGNKLRDHTNFGVGMEYDASIFPNKTKNALTNYSFDTDGDGLIEADCNGHAAVLATFYKAVGLTARPMAVDWKHKHYDTSTELWINGTWLVTRGYDHDDNLKSRSWWGNNVYGKSNDLILVAEPHWEWDRINVNYLGADQEDYFTTRYLSNSPAEYPYYPNSSSSIKSEIKRWDWISTPVREYWGYRPATWVDDCSGKHNNDKGCEGGRITLPFSETPSSVIEPISFPEIAYFKDVIGDYGLDTDNDGSFNELVVEVAIEVNQPGYYTIEATLNDLDPESRMGGQIDAVDWLQHYVYLESGETIVPLSFSGNVIRSKEAVGPFVLEELFLTDLENPLPGTVDEAHQIDRQHPNYIVNYSFAEFDDRGATLSENYSHSAIDTNNDGYLDQLTISTQLSMTSSNDHTVRADLVDTQGNIVATAEWTGNGSEVSLKFEGVLASLTPYYLRNLELLDANDNLIDTHGGGTNSYEFDDFAYSTGSLYNVGITPQSSELAVTAENAIDEDGDGKYDRLDFNVNVSTLASGQYTLEGWLESSTGALIAWKSEEYSLEAGSQSLALSFNGASINDFRANGPFKLIALKFSNLAGVLEEIHIAHETQDYSFNDFNGSETEANAVIIDGFENESQSTLWNLEETDWDITTQAFHTPSQSWTDSVKGKYSSDSTSYLTSNPISTPNGAMATISFHTCYDILDDGDQGIIEVRTNGDSDWIEITSFTGFSETWNVKEVGLAPATGSESIEFRFNLSSEEGGQRDGWYIDDLIVTLNEDVDGDGISNLDEGADLDSPTDTDEDGIPDFQETDSDDDGIADSIEGTKDTDNDNIPNFQDSDSDNDTIPDEDEWTDEENINNCTNDEGLDTDLDGIPNCQDNDIDGDGTPNAEDTDSDNDGTADNEEIGDDVSDPIDSDGDGIPDHLDSEDKTINEGPIVRPLFLPLIKK